MEKLYEIVKTIWYEHSFGNCTEIVNHLMEKEFDYVYSLMENYTENDEFFECFIIDDYLYCKLKEQNEIVIQDLYGLTIWCRTTFGQAVYMDSCIWNIAKEV